jgi:formylglycine-generating enzyme required for sulfatase activity
MAYLACMIFGDKRIAGIDLPKGNNNWGRDYQDPDSPENYGIEDPVKAGYSGNDIARVLTGSGPNSWSLTGHPLGVWDLNGNIWEWVDLLMGGGNSVSGVAGTDHIINPGFPEAGLTLPNSNNYITTLEDTDVNGKKAALPKTVGVAVNEYGKDYYYQNTGERAALRGGNWGSTSRAGVFGLNLSYAPSNTNYYVGFRAAR